MYLFFFKFSCHLGCYIILSRVPGDLGSIPGLGRSPRVGKRIPTPVFWPGEFHGLYNPCGHKELDTTKQLLLSLCYTVGPCCLSILYTAVGTSQFQTPQNSPASFLFLSPLSHQTSWMWSRLPNPHFTSQPFGMCILCSSSNSSH